jgi:hypothetical protein
MGPLERLCFPMEQPTNRFRGHHSKLVRRAWGVCVSTYVRTLHKVSYTGHYCNAAHTPVPPSSVDYHAPLAQTFHLLPGSPPPNPVTLPDLGSMQAYIASTQGDQHLDTLRPRPVPCLDLGSWLSPLPPRAFSSMSCALPGVLNLSRVTRPAHIEPPSSNLGLGDF